MTTLVVHSRWIATEVRLEYRSGLVVAAAVATTVWVVALRQLGAQARMIVFPLAVYIDSGVLGFLFAGGLVLLERRDGHLRCMAASPVRPGVYILVRVAVLTMLACVASLALAGATLGLKWSTLLVVPAVALLSPVALLASLCTATYAEKIARFVVAVQIPMVPVLLPPLALLDVIPDWVAMLVPTDAALQLLVLAADGTTSASRVVLGVSWTVVATALLFRVTEGLVAHRLLEREPG